MRADPVNVVYGLVPKEFPLNGSRCRDAVSALGEARMAHMIRMCGGSVDSSVFSDRDVTGPEGVWCVGREKLTVDAGGHRYTVFCIVPPDSGSPCSHGRRVCGVRGDVFCGERDKVLAETLLHVCQNRIAARVFTKDDRTSRLFRTYYVGDRVRIGEMFYDPTRFYKDTCLSQCSTHAFCRMMFAMACLMGDASSPDRRKRVLIPQRNKSADLIAMQRGSIFMEYFQDLDLDRDIDREWLDKVESAFRRSMAVGYVVPLRRFGVALRFRKIGDFSFMGVYYTYTKDIVLSPTGTEHFSHEYGHALYHAYGLRNDPGFLECYGRYAELLRHDPEVRGYSNLDYFLEKTEAFARMYNRFMFLRMGDGPLNTHAEDRVHPRDFLLDGMISRYFEDLFRRIS